jgi:tripartite-type tricarboxylate transporter receptor subunit TctC
MGFARSVTRLIGGAFAVALLFCTAGARAFPDKPIRLVVPQPPGGVPDTIARVMGNMLGKHLAWNAVVDNRPGAAGILAAELVAKAPPDGHTLFIADYGALAINVSLYPKLPYDPVKDFAPVTLAASGGLFLVAGAALPIHSVNELIAYAKANPGLPFGSAGNGTLHHLGLEQLKLLAGVTFTHVPYKGAAQVVPALLSGDIGAMLVALPSVLPHVRSGKVRLLAVSEAKRSLVMPDVPTIAEAGVPGYEIASGIGVVAPAGTPNAVIHKLNAEMVRMLQTRELAEQLVPRGINPVGSTPEEYAEKIRYKIVKYGKLLKASGARVD